MGEVVQAVPVEPKLTCTVGNPPEIEETAECVASVNVALAPPVVELTLQLTLQVLVQRVVVTEILAPVPEPPVVGSEP